MNISVGIVILALVLLGIGLNRKSVLVSPVLCFKQVRGAGERERTHFRHTEGAGRCRLPLPLTHTHTHACIHTVHTRARSPTRAYTQDQAELEKRKQKTQFWHDRLLKCASADLLSKNFLPFWILIQAKCRGWNFRDDGRDHTERMHERRSEWGWLL